MRVAMTINEELMFDHISEYRRKKRREEDDVDVQREAFARMEQDYLEQQVEKENYD
jgi:hypothetical protein